MRAAEDDRVDPGVLQRGGVLAHGGGGLLGERVVALDQRHEARAGDREHVDARVESAHELLVAAARDGRLRREQPDPAVARRLDGCVRLGSDHADDRHSQLGLELRQRGGGRRVAGDDDELHPLRLEEQADLTCEAAQLSERPRAVGEPRTVAEIDEVLVRKRDEALVQHRQATHARVEHADGPLVHGQDCREAVGRLPCRPCFAASFLPCSARSALAAPASAFTKEDGMQMMDDGVSLAYTLYTPDGAAPTGAGPASSSYTASPGRAAPSRRSRRLRRRGLLGAGLRRARPWRLWRCGDARRARGRSPISGPCATPSLPAPA